MLLFIESRKDISSVSFFDMKNVKKKEKNIDPNNVNNRLKIYTLTII